MKLIWQARCKTDPLDARKLADHLRTNLLPAIWVPTPEVRARRKLLRGRAYLVRLRTSVKNRIHGHLTAENCRTAVTDLYGRAGWAWLRTVELSLMGRFQVELLLEVVDALEAHIRSLDDRVKRLVKDDPGPAAADVARDRDVPGRTLARLDRLRTDAWFQDALASPF